MRFTDLIDGVETHAVFGDAEIGGVQYDSRRVQPGDCFVAMKGETTDGNRYIESALHAGAAAMVSDSIIAPPREGMAFAHVPHGRRALARISANFYGRPAEKLAIVGVTGTNGKTTTTFLLESMLRASGRRSALIGTIEYRLAGKIVAAPHTTPEALELNGFFAEAVAAGVKDAVMEVSSHALDQERVHGIPFEVAVFTNLTQDHLDYHGDMQSYLHAKTKLFSGVGTMPPRVAVINSDDEFGKELAKRARANGSQVTTYGLDSGDVSGANRRLEASGTRFTLKTPSGDTEIFSSLVGQVNIYNILAAAGAVLARGCSLEQIRKGVAALEYVPGRFQRVDAGQPFTLAVDYAHTDDALRNLTRVAREFVSRSGGRGRVITIFGCGGDRDRQKRPLMGRAAAEGSDFVILTSDNPRREDPLGIIHDALQGLLPTKTEFTIEPDRERAIRLAVRLAFPGDIVLVAGKGHEKVQILADRMIPFDDVEVSRRALYSAGFTDEFNPTVQRDEAAQGAR